MKLKFVGDGTRYLTLPLVPNKDTETDDEYEAKAMLESGLWVLDDEKAPLVEPKQEDKAPTVTDEPKVENVVETVLEPKQEN